LLKDFISSLNFIGFGEIIPVFTLLIDKCFDSSQTYVAGPPTKSRGV
jgi:hypothetical protein